MKICKYCKLDKEYSYFSRYKLSKDGYRYICKSCENTRKREKNKERKEERSSWAKQYREKNKDKLLEWQREYYCKNADKMRAASKKYYENNKEINKKRKRQYYYWYDNKKLKMFIKNVL